MTVESMTIREYYGTHYLSSDIIDQLDHMINTPEQYHWRAIFARRHYAGPKTVTGVIGNHLMYPGWSDRLETVLYPLFKKWVQNRFMMREDV